MKKRGRCDVRMPDSRRAKAAADNVGGKADGGRGGSIKIFRINMKKRSEKIYKPAIVCIPDSRRKKAAVDHGG